MTTIDRKHKIFIAICISFFALMLVGNVISSFSWFDVLYLAFANFVLIKIIILNKAK